MYKAIQRFCKQREVRTRLTQHEIPVLAPAAGNNKEAPGPWRYALYLHLGEIVNLHLGGLAATAEYLPPAPTQGLPLSSRRKRYLWPRGSPITAAASPRFGSFAWKFIGERSLQRRLARPDAPRATPSEGELGTRRHSIQRD